MAHTPKVLVLAGSTRKASFNKRLARLAAAAVRKAGGEATVLELEELKLPLYDGDLEEAHGLPEGAKTLKAAMLAHDALLLACPEYNSSITAVLKNAIDWASRQAPGEGALACFQEKTALLVSASPGALGGLRGLVVVRMLLSSIGVTVLPDQLAVSKAHEAFDDAGALKDAKQQATLEKLSARLVSTVAKLKG